MGRQIQLGQSIKILWERWLTQNVEEYLQFLKEEMEKGNKAQSGGYLWFTAQAKVQERQ